MSAAANESCPLCGVGTDERNHRIITDSCGHKKCRRCFLVDEQCSVCKQQAEAKQPLTISSAQRENVIVNTDNGKKKPKKRIGATPMPAHIQQVPTSDPGEFSFHCSNCGKSFRSRSQRYYHLSCGNESAKKYKCTHCERSFGSRSHLNYHLESHTAQVHRCTQCAMTFKNRRVLQKHQKRHETLPINCPECGKQFRCKEYLEPHLEMHRNNLRFECAVCGQKYAVKTALKQHMQKHLAKQYACSFCGKYFQRNSTLNLHLKRHTKTESFRCKTCTKIFSDADTLKRHAKIHEKAVVKYKCTECDITTVRKDNMLRHVRNMHPGEEFNACVEIIKEHDVPATSQTESASDAPIERDTFDEEILTEEEDGVASDEEILTEEEDGVFEEHPTLLLPKAIENSCVIRCIGNVEPVRMPIPSLHLNEYADVVEPLEQTTTAPSALINLENVTFNYIEKATITHKKLQKKYDPIELYRKILMPSDEDEGESAEEVAEAPREANNSAVALGTEVTERRANVLQLYQPIEAAAAKPRSEMHWRKNFKYTYQYQDY